MLGRLEGLLGDIWEYRLRLHVGGRGGGGCEGVAGSSSLTSLCEGVAGCAITSSLTSRRVKGQLGRRGGWQDWLLQNICLMMELSLLQVRLKVLVNWLLELLLWVWPELLSVLLELLRVL